jgi:hypothetical protein
MVAKKIGPEEYERLFASLRSLVDQTEAAYLSGNLPLARHATANLSFATNLIHSSLREEESASVTSSN